ncbi:hypothetical protein HD806DRAFT_544952 [Xylariaceae sp. AK1471]|nr:hypothetical protein HD806DRAFT_544952 [Xylariaceae sp. AK1471]
MLDRKEPQIAALFTSRLRQTSYFSCPVAGCTKAFPAIDNKIRDHFQSKHSDYFEGKVLNSPIRDIKYGRVPAAHVVEPLGPIPESLPIRDLGGGDPYGVLAAADDAGSPSYRRPQSTVASPIKTPRARSTSPTPRRFRAHPQQSTTNDPGFLRQGYPQGKLWNPEEYSSPSTFWAKPSSSRSSTSLARPRKADSPDEDSEALRFIKQPETHPISQKQLVAEVKGIYARLIMVETKSIEVIHTESTRSDTKLNNEQWQALTALQRALLHEHHDFFLASQHPSASQALKRLASKYAMPARMWRYGIHSYLELLRRDLPGSLENILTFIYLAYSMIALLYETVPAFEDTWIECLGDLARYKIAIEEDSRDREIWTSVSRLWYSKASDKAPTTGRLYHHLAILARPNALQQLFYYTKSLCVPIPFGSVKESIMTLFDPILSASSYQHAHLPTIEVAFLKAHGILFSHKQLDNFRPAVDEFLESLDGHVGRIKRQWVESGYYIAIANCCALMSYGKEENVIMRAIHYQSDEKQNLRLESGGTDMKPSKDFEDALHLTMGTHEIIFRRLDDANVLPYIHVVMVFMLYLSRLPNAMCPLEHRFPWKGLSVLLNSLLDASESRNRIRSDEFPREGNDLPRPVPEDFALKGLLFVDQYYPSDWFSNEKLEDDEKYFELPSTKDVRKERILWLAYRIARAGRWLTYNESVNQFGVIPKYEMEMEDISKDADMMNM